MRRRIVGGLLLVLTLIGVGTASWAYWTSAGTGGGTATTATLNPATDVTATYTLGLNAVAVSWSAPTGLTPQGYYVTRTSGATTAAACASSAASLVTTTSCTDPLSTAGSYTYKVTAVFNSWTSVSGSSGSVPVTPDTTGPTVDIATINGLSPTFPYSTNASIQSIGGTCGTAPGDNFAVTVLVNSTFLGTATCTGIGSWTLVLNPALSTTGSYPLSASQTDLTGNAGTSPIRSVSLDTTAPTLTSITRAGSAQAVNTGPLLWTVTFSEQVTGVASGNFSLTTSGLGGTGSPVVAAPTAPSGSLSATWSVSVGMENVSGTDAGSIALNLASATSIKDAAGNVLATASQNGPAYTYDTTAPIVTSVTSSLANGSYKAGQVVPVTVAFSEPLSVSGTPQLTMRIAPSANRAVNCAPGTTTSELICNYIVASGDSSADLDYAASSSLALNGGAIKDVAGNAALLTLAAPGATNSLGHNKALVIDTAAPTATSIALPSGAPTAVKTGPLSWKVTFSEPVSAVTDANFTFATSGITGTPTVQGVTPDAGSEPSAIWTVATDESGVNGADGATLALRLYAIGAIADAAGNPLSTSALTGASYTFDTTPPEVTISTLGGSAATFPVYTNAGSVRQIGGRCGAQADGNLAPVTLLINGAATTPATASCLSSGTWNLTLTTALTAQQSYLLTARQSDSLLNLGTSATQTLVIDRTAPTLASLNRAGTSPANSGPLDWTATFSEPVTGVATTNFGLTTTLTSGSALIDSVYPSGAAPAVTWTVHTVEPGAQATNGSILLRLTGRGSVIDRAGNALATTSFTGQSYAFDTTAPTVTNVTSGATNMTYKVGDVIAITVKFTEAVTVVGAPQLRLATGTPPAVAGYVPGSPTDTLTFSYAVAQGHSSSDLDYAATSPLLPNNATIRDAAGNDANLTLPAPGATGSLGANKAIVIDGIRPGVTNVTSSAANTAYKLGDAISITVKFSEVVTVSGAPQLALATGTVAGAATYSSGSGSDTLTFNYTVLRGHASSDLDYAATTSLVLPTGSSIRDGAGNDADLTLATPGDGGSLGANKAIVIDGIPPVVQVTSLSKSSLWIIRTVTLSGTAEAGGQVTVYVCTSATCNASNASANATVSVDGSGNWTKEDLRFLSASGTFYAVAIQTDSAGNVGTSPIYTGPS